MEQELELRELVNIVWKHRVLIIALFIGAIAAAVVGSQMMTPIYETGTTIIVENASGMENPFEQMLNMDKPEVADFAEILKSRNLLFRVASNLGLVQSEDSEELRALQESVSVQPVTGTNLIKIQVESADPEQARKLANGLAKEFIAQNEELNRTEARGAREFIAEQLVIVTAELEKADAALLAFKQENKIYAPEEEVKAILDQLTELDKMRAEALVGKAEVDASLSEVNKQLSRVADRIVSSTTVTGNPVVEGLKSRLATLEIELSGARKVYTDKHPTVMSLLAQIDEVKGRMLQEAERVVSAETETLNPFYQALSQQAGQLEVEQLALGVRMDILETLIAEQERRFGQLPQKELELANLLRNANVTEQTYIMLKQKYEEVRITEAMKTANVRVIDQALLPNNPVRPRKLLNIVIAAFLGIFVGVGLAFVIEFMDTTIRTPEEAEEILGLPVLGQIPSYLPEHMPREKNLD